VVALGEMMTALQVADWRRQIFALYAEVRAATDLFAAHDLWRRERDRLFATHPSTPLLPDDRTVFTGLSTTSYDPDWRFEVEVTPAESRHLDVETGTDGIVPFDLIGVAEVPGVGSLDIWKLGSYGGGRYLLDTIKGADLGPGAALDSLVLDFNFAYNPSCAYDPAWACPLAQAGNRIAVEIPAGERYSGAH